jgi:uncharacterized BrkB/YihY/UPF0761 family membrane protein
LPTSGPTRLERVGATDDRGHVRRRLPGLSAQLAFYFPLALFPALIFLAIGGVIVLMLWFYLAGFALLVSAELNSEIDKALPRHDDAPQGPERQKRIGPAAEHTGSHSAR